MRDMPRRPYIYTALIILVFWNILCFEEASGQAVKSGKTKPAAAAPVIKNEAVEKVAATAETAVNKAAGHETSQAELKKEAEKKKKKNLKRNIYIFDTIVSGLMHLLMGTGLFMIVLMILKWFFLERRVEK